MAELINLAKPLRLSTPGIAPIADLVVADTAALEAIASPWLGMVVFVEADGKSRRVTSLKEVAAGPLTRKAVDGYEIVPDRAEVDDKAPKNHRHDDDYAAKQATAEALEGKLDADKLGVPGGAASLTEAGTVPAEQLPSGIGALPATIALPVPCDEDNENLTLVVDFSSTGEFVATGETAYSRVRMSDSYAKMRIFNGSDWEPVPGPSVGVPYYACTVEFTLDQELFPGYVPGQKYYARYCWIDSAGNPGDWVGFAFTGDVADLVPIHTNDKTPLKVRKEVEKNGVIQLNFLDGEVQNFKLTGNANIDLGNVSNVPFGEALIANVRTDGHTLSVSNAGKSYSCPDDKVYVIAITNFGNLNIAVTETI